MPSLAQGLSGILNFLMLFRYYKDFKGLLDFLLDLCNQEPLYYTLTVAKGLGFSFFIFSVTSDSYMAAIVLTDNFGFVVKL